MLCLKDEAFAFAPPSQGLMAKGLLDERKRIDGLVRTLGRCLCSCICIFHVLGMGRGLMDSLLSWISLELIEQGTGVAARFARYFGFVYLRFHFLGQVDEFTRPWVFSMTLIPLSHAPGRFWALLRPHRLVNQIMSPHMRRPS